jgi:hypothetical protein
MLPEPPLPQTLEEAHGLVRVLWAELLAVRAELAGLQTRVQELEARLGQNSSNSSRPPSTDPPSTPKRPPAPPTGRRRGAQPAIPPTSGCWCRPTKWMPWSPTGPSSVGAVKPPWRPSKSRSSVSQCATR